MKHDNTHTHTAVLLLCWNLSGTTQVSRYQKGKTRKGKTNLNLLEQEIVSGSGICWAICKSAPHPRQPRQHPTTITSECQHDNFRMIKHRNDETWWIGALYKNLARV